MSSESSAMMLRLPPLLLLLLAQRAAAPRPSAGCSSHNGTLPALNASAAPVELQLVVTDRHNLTMTRSYVLSLPATPQPHGPACTPGAQPPQLCPTVPPSACPPSGECPPSGGRAPPKPLPLLLYFPGQTVDATDAAATITDFVGIGNQKGFATAFLQGVGAEDGNCSSGWNVGGTAHPGGIGSSCTRLAWSEFGCHCSCCYRSCQALGHCTADGEGAQCG
jgi:hypothetical protein